jgi:hypothetical protein
MGGKSMKRFLSLTMCLAMVAAASMAFAATSGTNARDLSGYQRAVDGPGVVGHSASSSQHVALRELAGPDTFVLYGGPAGIPRAGNPADGKFGTIGSASRDGWDGYDLTDNPVFWHVSTFNAANLNNNGAGNLAMWSGVEASHPAGWSDGWISPPGYGNLWDDALLYESDPLTGAALGEQTVDLDFFCNYDTEGGWDFFTVEYDSAGTWVVAATFDASNGVGGVFAAPGVQFSTAPEFTGVDGHPIYYSGLGDYGGPNSDQVRIRLRFTSDGAYSDGDGFWPTDGGAVQVDDISLNHLGLVAPLFEDYETPANPDPFNPEPVGTYLFDRDKAPWVGDFSDVYTAITSIDPCRENFTPVMGLIDYGQVPPNAPGLFGDFSTGGATGSTTYGIPGNWVVNYDGGLSNNLAALTNEVWSPDIFWDYDGTAAGDEPEVAGAWIRWTSWTHLPLANGMFYVWHVRSALAGDFYGPWQDRNFVYYGGGVPVWANYVQDVSNLLEPGPEKVQIALGAWDYADIFNLPGIDATPSPCFDNVAMYKYRLGGPVFSFRTIDLANDGFPVSGSLDFSTEAARDGLDIPFDMANDVNSGETLLVPGDSVIVDIESVIPTATVASVKMYWSLKKNTFFEDTIRAQPARAKDIPNAPVGDFWSGTVLADTSKNSAGNIITGRWFVDLPDVDFLYPGDVLEYYLEAVDSEGRTTTLPANTTGFGLADGTFSRTFTVRGLPSVTDLAGTQPSVLVWNDFGRRGGEQHFTTAFGQIGYVEGVDYDTYTTQGPTSGVGNGLGSNTPTGGHGADPQQLVGYDSMFYFVGNLSSGHFSDGTNKNGNSKADDVNVMTQWAAQNDGAKNCAYFGDYIARGLFAGGPSLKAQTYLQDVMGVDYTDPDVRDVIGGQQAPLVKPTGAHAQFVTDYVAFGGCLTVNQFDQISPLPNAVAGHGFWDPVGLALYPTAVGAASVVYDNPASTGVGYHATFPYADYLVYDPPARAGISSRAKLFQELLGLFGEATSGGTVVSAPTRARAELSVRPNPFNPSTQIEFANTRGLSGYVKVYNLRGELVRTLHNGEFQVESFRWDGTDNRGASVASGVYVIKAVADGQVQTKKAALVK